MPKTARRLCPYCGEAIDLAQCAIVATSHLTGSAFGDSVDSDEGSQAGLEKLWAPSPVAPASGRGQIWRMVDPRPGNGTVPLTQFPAERLARRQCTSCGEPLPPSLDDRMGHIVSVVGLNFAGKTNYLATALTLATKQQGLRPLAITEFASDEETAGRFHRDYYTPVFRAQRVLESTQSDPDAKKRPLVFNVSPPGCDPIVVLTHDVSGEALMDYRARAETASFVRRSSGLIFMIDPLEFDFVRRCMPDELIPRDRDIDQVDLLVHTLRELEYDPGGQQVPVAIVIAKSDLIAEFLPGDYEFTRPHSEKDWLKDIRNCSNEVKAFLADIGETRLLTVAEDYGHVTFHAVSSFGRAPLGQAIATAAPIRVLDPLGAVLLRLSAALPAA